MNNLLEFGKLQVPDLENLFQKDLLDLVRVDFFLDARIIKMKSSEVVRTSPIFVMMVSHGREYYNPHLYKGDGIMNIDNYEHSEI